MDTAMQYFRKINVSEPGLLSLWWTCLTFLTCQQQGTLPGQVCPDDEPPTYKFKKINMNSHH